MKRRILVIDDEPDILDLARIALETGDFEVTAVPSAEEAISIITRDRPALVLLDVILPKVSGLELCRRIKRDPVTRGIKVILFTALGTEVDMMLEKQDKADGYLAKPFSNTGLLGLANRLLDA